MLPHRAYVIVFLGVVIRVLCKKGVVRERLLLFLVEIVVLDEESNMVLLQELVVLFTPVTRIGDGLGRVFPVALPETVQERFQGERVTGVGKNIIMGEGLVFSDYLHIVCRFELPVLHMVVFQTHESGGIVRLGVAVTAFQDFKVFLLFLEFGKMFVFHCPDRLLLLLAAVLRYALFQFFRVQGAGRFILRQVILRDTLLDKLQYLADLFLQPGLVLLNRPAPYERVTVGMRLYLRPVNIGRTRLRYSISTSIVIT